MIVIGGGCARGSVAASNDDPGAPDAPGAPPRPDAPRPPDAPSPDAPPPPPPPPPACVPMTTQLLGNPLFDQGPQGAGWVQQPIDSSFPLVTAQDGPAEHSAPYKAWLGGFTGANVRDSLYQDVVVPPLTKQVVLAGFYQVHTDETSGSVYDSVTATLTLTNGAIIATALQASNLTPQTSWAQFYSTVASTGAQDLSGLTVRVRFSSRNDGAKPTSFFFDTVSLTATHGCP
jgi:hypothetical protein